MDEGPLDYQSYLLRLWRASRRRQEGWRASLEDTRTGRRHGFATLDALIAFIRQQDGASPAEPRDAPTGEEARRSFDLATFSAGSASSQGEVRMGYNLEGRLLEVCDCNVLCPCWIGEDPDNGTCQGTVGWHIDSGTIDGVDVSGRSFIITGHIPGNVLKGNWKMIAVIDHDTTQEQADAILKVWTGQAGGPVADLAQLVGEVVAVEKRRITFEVEGGKGFLKIEGILEAEMAPYQGATGVTTLNDSVFSTIPGSPAYVSKAASYTRTTKQWGLPDVDLKGHNAVQGHFHFVA